MNIDKNTIQFLKDNTTPAHVQDFFGIPTYEVIAEGLLVHPQHLFKDQQELDEFLYFIKPARFPVKLPQETMKGD